MAKRILRTLTCLLLIATMVVAICAPCGMAATAKTKIVRTNASDVRLHYKIGGGGEDTMIKTLKKGTRLLCLSTSDKFWLYVTASNGLKGYIYKDYVSDYGAVAKKSVYVVKSGTKLQKYKLSGKRLKKASGKLSGNTVVIVRATKNGYAYVQTLSGSKTYVKLSGLKKVF